MSPADPREPEQTADRIAVSPREAARLLGISVPTMYVLLNSGQIPSVRANARRLISVQALHAFIGDAA